MKRRKALQSIAVGALGSGLAVGTKDIFAKPPRNVRTSSTFSSQWNRMPDMIWLGPEYWANRLQDWRLHGGKAECVVLGANRNVHLLTHQVKGAGKGFKTSVALRLNEAFADDFAGVVGFSLGLKGKFPGYQSACITGKGIYAGVDQRGRLVIGDEISAPVIDPEELYTGIRLTAEMDANRLVLRIHDANDRELTTFSSQSRDSMDWTGNIALLVHSPGGVKDDEAWKVRFSDWQVEGERIHHGPDQEFGPVCFTQYTLEQGILKLTAQLAPIDREDTEVALWFQRNGSWEKAATSGMRMDSRTSHFRVENWKDTSERPFRVTVTLPLRDGHHKTYMYEGAITAEPVDKDTIVAMATSCNGDFGFPDHEVVENGLKHDPDVILFLGDQIYERNGGYGVQNNPPYLKADLDFLRK